MFNYLLYTLFEAGQCCSTEHECEDSHVSSALSCVVSTAFCFNHTLIKAAVKEVLQCNMLSY